MTVVIAVVFATLVFLLFEVWRSLAHAARERKGRATARRIGIYQKAWNMVFGGRRPRRLTYRKPDEPDEPGVP